MADYHDTLLAKWLSGSLTKSEHIALKDQYDLEALEEVLKKQSAFELETAPAGQLWSDFLYKKSQKRSEPNLVFQRRNVLLLAAITILALLTVWFYQSKNSNEIFYTPNGVSSSYAMSDGTKIFLSPGSSITADTNSWSSQRQLHLQGQAYFEVVAGSPFVVSLNAGEVTVVGTSFDIWDIDQRNAKIICTSGAVTVATNKGASKTLNQQQELTITNNVLSEIGSYESNSTDWTSGKKNYKSAKAIWIIKDLERFYDVSISISEKLEENLFSGVIPLNDQDKALTYLTQTMGWKYVHKGIKIEITSG